MDAKSLILSIGLFLILFSACDNQIENMPITSDNEKENIEGVKYYATEEEFLQSLAINTVNIAKEENNDFLLTRAANNAVTQETVKGYDYKANGTFDKCRFGSWVEKYGLIAGNIYLMAECQVYKHLPCISTDLLQPRDYKNLTNEPMGYKPGYLIDGNLVKGFNVNSYNPAGYRDGQTMLRYVTSDLSGKKLDVYMPFRPENLVWYYQKVNIPEWQ